MSYYIEGMIKKVSIVKGTFSISPRKEYEHEEGGKKFLLAVEEKAITPDSIPPFQSLLLSETSEFSFLGHKCQLAIAASSKTLVGIKFDIDIVGIGEKEDLVKTKSPIKVVDLIVLG